MTTSEAPDPDGMPTRRQRLAVELRRLRDLAGLSGRDLAQRVGISQSKVSRIESGAAIPTLPEVTAWTEAVEAPAETRERLAAATEAVFTEVYSWRSAIRARGHLQDEIEERETRARWIRTFQPSVIPGLLQTAEYAKRMFSLGHMPCGGQDVPAAVAGRLQRQLVIYEEDRRFDFLITEAALRWHPGPVAMLQPQLDRLATLSTLENVSIGLIPHSRQAVTTMSHGFVIYDGHDDSGAFVEVETIHANLIIKEPPDDIELYETRWSLLGQMALVDDEARKFLAVLINEIRGSRD